MPYHDYTELNQEINPNNVFVRAKSEGSTVDDGMTVSVLFSKNRKSEDIMYRIGFFDSVDDIAPQSVSDSTYVLQGRASYSYYLQRYDFKCATCDDYKIYYNFTSNQDVSYDQDNNPY